MYLVNFSRCFISSERVLKLSLLFNDIFLINLLFNNSDSTFSFNSKLYLFKKGEFLRVKKKFKFLFFVFFSKLFASI